MRSFFTALLGMSISLPGSWALPPGYASSRPDVFVILDDHSLPFPKLGLRMVSPRRLTPELSNFPADLSNLPLKTMVNIDGEDIVIFAQKQEFVTKATPILKQYMCSNPEHAPFFPVMCRVGHGAKTKGNLCQSTSMPVDTRRDYISGTTITDGTGLVVTAVLKDDSNVTTPENTGSGKATVRESRHNCVARTHWTADQPSHDSNKGSTEGISFALPSDSIPISGSEQFTSIRTLTRSDGFNSLRTASQHSPRTKSTHSGTVIKAPTDAASSWHTTGGPLNANSEVGMTSGSAVVDGFPTTEATRPMILKQKQSSQSPTKAIIDTASDARLAKAEPTITIGDTFPSTLGVKTTTAAATIQLIEIKRTSPHFPFKLAKKINLMPSWLTIGIGPTTDQNSGPGNGGAGHGGPTPTRPKPEYPTELISSTIMTKRSPSAVGRFNEPMTTGLEWDAFGAAASPTQSSDDALKDGSEDNTYQNWKDAHNATIEQVNQVQGWVKDILDRAETEFEKIIDTLSEAVGAVNMIMGWNRDDSQI